MKTLILSGLTAATMLAALGTASAQQTVIITEEQVPVVREYIVRQNVTPVEPVQDYDFAVGSTVPEVVEIRPLEVPELTDRYEYVVTTSGQTILVDPATREVIQVLD